VKVVSCIETALVARQSSWPRKTNLHGAMSAIKRASEHATSARGNIFQRSILIMFTRMIQIRGLNVPTVGADTSITAKNVRQSTFHYMKDGHGRRVPIAAKCATRGEVEF